MLYSFFEREVCHRDLPDRKEELSFRDSVVVWNIVVHALVAVMSIACSQSTVYCSIVGRQYSFETMAMCRENRVEDFPDLIIQLKAIIGELKLRVRKPQATKLEHQTTSLKPPSQASP